MGITCSLSQTVFHLNLCLSPWIVLQGFIHPMGMIFPYISSWWQILSWSLSSLGLTELPPLHFLCSVLIQLVGASDPHKISAGLCLIPSMVNYSKFIRLETSPPPNLSLTTSLRALWGLWCIFPHNSLRASMAQLGSDARALQKTFVFNTEQEMFPPRCGGGWLLLEQCPRGDSSAGTGLGGSEHRGALSSSSSSSSSLLSPWARCHLLHLEYPWHTALFRGGFA